MPAAANRLEFAPPMPQGTGRAFGLAVLAHLFLAGALTWGVNWKREAAPATVEAELWSALPQQAAPKLQEAAPPPPPPKPIPKEEPPPPKAPDIITEKIKPKPEPKVAPQPESKPKPEPEAKPTAKVQSKPELKPQINNTQDERQKNLDRIAGMAGASGASNASGNTTQSSGPSSGYAGLIKGKVRPNLVFTDSMVGNPEVTVEVRLAPDGTILGRPQVTKTSGNKDWDDAVVRAFEKTESLPRDNGKIWSPLEIKWRMSD